MIRILKLVVLAMILMGLYTACAEAPEPLRLNSRGDDVEQVQRRLVELGYLDDGADGIFGTNTANAVCLFQYLARLEVTGVVDQATKDALISDDARTVHAALEPGDKSDEVRELQQRLKAWGFLKDSADGIYGQNTVTAVKALQTHMIEQGLQGEGVLQMEPTGVATPLTQEYLYSQYYTVHLHNLHEGFEGDEVRRLEKRLVSLGYMDAEPDQVFDEYTAQVVCAFRAENGLEEGEIVDQAMSDLLYSLEMTETERCVPHAIGSGDSGRVVRDAQKVLMRYGFIGTLPDGIYGEDMENAVQAFHDYLEAADSPLAKHFETRDALGVEALNLLYEEDLFFHLEDVESGASSHEIRRLQNRLHTLYYLDRFASDGLFGKNTRNAIERFQANNGLEETGVADEGTLRALYSEEAVGEYTPYKLGISIDDQRVYVYELKDGEYQQIHSYICSTGLGNSTPKGIFLDACRVDRWHYFVKFKCWAQYAYQVEGAILMHSVLYDRKDVDTLREGSVWALGSKASHGCIRLMPEDAGWIYENCENGTIIEIY